MDESGTPVQHWFQFVLPVDTLDRIATSNGSYRYSRSEQTNLHRSRSTFRLFAHLAPNEMVFDKSMGEFTALFGRAYVLVLNQKYAEAALITQRLFQEASRYLRRTYPTWWASVMQVDPK